MRISAEEPGAAGEDAAVRTAITAEPAREAFSAPLCHTTLNTRRNRWSRRSAFSVVACCCWWLSCPFSLAISDRHAVSAKFVVSATAAVAERHHPGLLAPSKVTLDLEEHRENDKTDDTASAEETAAGRAAVVREAATGADIAAGVDLMTEEATRTSANKLVETPGILSSKAATAEQREPETPSAVPSLSFKEAITPQEDEYGSLARRLLTSAGDGEEEKEREQQESREGETACAPRLREHEPHQQQEDKQQTRQQETNPQREKEIQGKVEMETVQRGLNSEGPGRAEAAGEYDGRDVQAQSGSDIDREAALTFVQEQLQQLEPVLRQQLKAQTLPTMFRSRVKKEEDSSEHMSPEDSLSDDPEIFILPSREHSDLDPLILPGSRSRSNIIARLTKPLRNSIRSHKRNTTRKAGGRKQQPQWKGGDENDSTLMQFPEEDDSAEASEEDVNQTAEQGEQDGVLSWTDLPYNDEKKQAQTFSQDSTRAAPATRQVVFQNKKPQPLFSGFRHKWETRAVPKLKPIGEKMLTFAQQVLDRLISTAQPHPYVVVQGQPQPQLQQQQEQQSRIRAVEVTEPHGRSSGDNGSVYDAFFAGAEAAFAATSKSGRSSGPGEASKAHGRKAPKSEGAEKPTQKQKNAKEGETQLAARNPKTKAGAEKSGREARRLSEQTTVLHTAVPVLAHFLSPTSTAADDTTQAVPESQETAAESVETSPRGVLPAIERGKHEHFLGSAHALAASLEEPDFPGSVEQQGPQRRLVSYGINRPPTPMPKEEVEHFPFRGWRVRNARERFAPVVYARTWGEPRDKSSSEEEREFNDLAAKADINEDDDEEDETFAEEDESITEDFKLESNDFVKGTDIKNRAMFDELERHEPTIYQDLYPPEGLPSFNLAELPTHVRDSKPEQSGNECPNSSANNSTTVTRRLATGQTTTRTDKKHSQQSGAVCNSEGKLPNGSPCSGVPHYLPRGVDEELHMRQLKLIDEFLERTFGTLPDVLMDDSRRMAEKDDDKEGVDYFTKEGFGRRISKAAPEETGRQEDAGDLPKSNQRATDRASKTPAETAKQPQSGFERPPTPIPVGYKSFFPSFGDGPMRLRADQRLPSIQDSPIWDGRHGETSSEVQMDVSDTVTGSADSRQSGEARTLPNKFPVLPGRRERESRFEKLSDGGRSANRGRTQHRVSTARRSRKSLSSFTEAAGSSGSGTSAHTVHEGSLEDTRTASSGSKISDKTMGGAGNVTRRLQAGSPSGRLQKEAESDDNILDASRADLCSDGPECLSQFEDGEQSSQQRSLTKPLNLGDREEQNPALHDARRIFDNADETGNKQVDQTEEGSSQAREPGPHPTTHEANTASEVLRSLQSERKSPAEPEKPLPQHVRPALKRRPTPFPRRGRRVPRVPRGESRQPGGEALDLAAERDDITQTSYTLYEEPDLDADMELDDGGWAEGDVEPSETADEEVATSATYQGQANNKFMRTVNRGKRTLIKALRQLLYPTWKKAMRESEVGPQNDGGRLFSYPAADEDWISSGDTISSRNNTSSTNSDTHISGIESDTSTVRPGNERRLTHIETGSRYKEKEAGTGWMLISGSRDPRGRPLDHTCVRCEKVVLCLVLFPGIHTIESCSLMFLPEGIDEPYAVFTNKCSPCSSWGTDRPLPVVLSSNRYVRFIKPAALFSYSESENIAALAANVYADMNEIATTTSSFQSPPQDAANTTQAERLPEEDRKTVESVYEEAQSSPTTVSLLHVAAEDGAAPRKVRSITDDPAVSEQTTADEEIVAELPSLVQTADAEAPGEAAPVETRLTAEDSAAPGVATVEQAASHEARAKLAESGAPSRRLADADLFRRIEEAEWKNLADETILSHVVEQEGRVEERGEEESTVNEVRHVTEQLHQYSSDAEQLAELSEQQQQSILEEMHLDEAAEQEHQHSVEQQQQLAETETQHFDSQQSILDEMHLDEAAEQKPQHSIEQQQQLAETETQHFDTQQSILDEMHLDEAAGQKPQHSIEQQQQQLAETEAQHFDSQQSILEEIHLDKAGEQEPQHSLKQQQRLAESETQHIELEEQHSRQPTEEQACDDTCGIDVNTTADRDVVEESKHLRRGLQAVSTEGDEQGKTHPSPVCPCTLGRASQHHRLRTSTENSADTPFDMVAPEDGIADLGLTRRKHYEDGQQDTPLQQEGNSSHSVSEMQEGTPSTLSDGGDLSALRELASRKRILTISDLAPAFAMRRPQRNNSSIEDRLKLEHQLPLESRTQHCRCISVKTSEDDEQEQEEMSVGRQQSGTATTTLKKSQEKKGLGQLTPARLHYLQAHYHPTMAAFWEAMAGLLLTADEEQIAQLRRDRGAEEEYWAKPSGVYTLPAACCNEVRKEDRSETQPAVAAKEEAGRTRTDPAEYSVGVQRTTETPEKENPETLLPLSSKGNINFSGKCRFECRITLLPRPALVGKRHLYAVKSRNPLHMWVDQRQQKQLTDRAAKDHKSMTNFWEGIAALLKGGAVKEVKNIRKRRGML